MKMNHKSRNESLIKNLKEGVLVIVTDFDFLVHPVQDYRNDQIKTRQQNQCNKKSHVIQLMETR